MFLVKVPISKVFIREGERIFGLHGKLGRVREVLPLAMPQAIHEIAAVDVSVGFSISSVLYLTLNV